MTTPLRVARILHSTTSEGPGQRTAIWFQGCSIRCRGCINPHLFEPTGGRFESASAIVDSAVRAGDEGLTLLGGEPFDQTVGAGELAHTAQDRGLGVVTFTGHRHEALLRIPTAEPLLQYTDLLVDGPFDATQPEKIRNLVGSANQRFIYLTDRYANFDPAGRANSVDIRIGADGTVRIAGFLNSRQLRSVVSGLGVHRPINPASRLPVTAADHPAGDD